ncbi:MAG TPA: hypothetical protein VFO36_08325, partial [Nitrospiraceae bacterium]|nr:hypothetical protein [Nitrospiraceae bacterium]
MHWKIQLGGFFLPVAMATIQSSAGDTPTRHLSGTASLPPGFLPRDQLPNSLTLLPPPPQPDSPAFSSDVAAARRFQALQNSARWKLAASDADLAFPHAPGAFACAAGVRIGADTTPLTYQLMAKSMVDVGLSTYAAK